MKFQVFCRNEFVAASRTPRLRPARPLGLHQRIRELNCAGGAAREVRLVGPHVTRVRLRVHLFAVLDLADAGGFLVRVLGHWDLGLLLVLSLIRNIHIRLPTLGYKCLTFLTILLCIHQEFQFVPLGTW